jgi:hypothetical protein
MWGGNMTANLMVGFPKSSDMPNETVTLVCKVVSTSPPPSLTFRVKQPNRA